MITTCLQPMLVFMTWVSQSEAEKLVIGAIGQVIVALLLLIALFHLFEVVWRILLRLAEELRACVEHLHDLLKQSSNEIRYWQRFWRKGASAKGARNPEDHDSRPNFPVTDSVE